jgi:hypothetical protein
MHSVIITIVVFPVFVFRHDSLEARVTVNAQVNVNFVRRVVFKPLFKIFNIVGFQFILLCIVFFRKDGHPNLIKIAQFRDEEYCLVLCKIYYSITIRLRDSKQVIEVSFLVNWIVTIRTIEGNLIDPLKQAYALLR